MPRGKVLTKKVSQSSKDETEAISKLFGQMTGMQDAEPEVIISKLVKIYNIILKYNKLYNILLKFDEFKELFSEYATWFDEISNFLKELLSSTDVDITEEYTTESAGMLKYKNMDSKELNVFYKKFKDNRNIKKIIITGSNLSIYKKYIVDKNKLSDAFIKREPGISLTPLAFTLFDLKLIWNSGKMSDQAKQFVLSIISHTYNLGIEIYEIITSPDVDIKKFSKILINSITKMKKQIPRCDAAFAVIEKSVSLLEDNFKSYYRNSIEAENPSIIVESFIVDISTSQKASPAVTAQFKKIVMFLKQNSQQNNDPKVKKLFSMLNMQFSAIDKELGIKEPKESTNPAESPESTNPAESPESTNPAESPESTNPAESPESTNPAESPDNS
jgi:hypothetical protein